MLPRCQFQCVSCKSISSVFCSCTINPSPNDRLEDSGRKHSYSTDNGHAKGTTTRYPMCNGTNHNRPEITDTHCKDYGCKIGRAASHCTEQINTSRSQNSSSQQHARLA